MRFLLKQTESKVKDKDLTPIPTPGGEEGLAGPHAVETNKPYDPVHVGSLGVNGKVVQTEYLSDLIEGVLAVDFLSSQAYKTPLMIPRDR